MAKQKKRLWSLLLIVMMVFTTVFTNTDVSIVAKAAEKITVDAEQVQAGQTIVHFKPTSMSTPYIWAYGANEENYCDGAQWPGKLMTSEGNGWYTYTIEASSAYVIFSDNGNNQEPGANQPGYAVSGEIWYIQGNGGSTTTSAPDQPTAAPTPTAAVSPTPVPATDIPEPTETTPTGDKIAISNVTPGDGEIKVNETVTLKTEVVLDNSIDYAYYKYEVKHNGQYVGDHYYSKASEYSFKPEEEGTYTVEVFAQAHDMENTTVTKTVTFQAVKTSLDDPTDEPNPTATVEPTSPVDTEIPSDTNKPDETQNPDATVIPNETFNPSGTTAPNGTANPSGTTNPNGTTAPSGTAAPNGTANPDATTQPDQTALPGQTDTPDSPIDPNAFGVKTFTADIVSPQTIGSTITFMAEGQGGSGSYEYKFDVSRIVEAVSVPAITQSYSESNTFEWTPEITGDYQVVVSVKDTVSGEVAVSTLEYVINDVPSSDEVTSIKLKLSRTTPQYRGRAIKLTASVTGGSNLQYKFTLINTKTKATKVLQKYSTSKTYTWRPGKTNIGTYKFRVLVKSNGVKVGSYTSSKFKIKNKKLSIDSTSVSAKSTYYAVAANTAGGYGTIKYKYVIKNAKGKVVFKRAYKTTRIAKWKPTKGVYKIYTYVKDSKTTKTLVKKKTIKKKL